MIKYFNDAIRVMKNLSMAVKSFLVVVIFPTLISFFYYGLISSDIYISEAQYAVRTNTESPSISLMDSIFGATNTTSSNDDKYVVRDYILSRDILDKLEQEINLKEHYKSSNIDYFSRLDKNASQEEFYKYYLDKIEIKLDVNSSIGTLRVRAYTPEFAQKLALLIIDKSEELVNNITNRIMDDTLKYAKNEVANAETLVRKASGELSQFRNRSKTINPGKETEAVLSIVSDIESKIAQTRAELIEAESYMKSTSPQVISLRAKVDALEKQRENEKLRLATGNKGDDPFTRLIYDYEPLELNKELAEKQYASALNSLELARAEAQRKQRYLITIVNPKIPDDAQEPERLMKVLTVFFATLLTYGIGWLIWAAIKDHMRN